MLRCRELRQVLSDILPGGSESPSTSARTSTDRSKNSGDLLGRPVNGVDGPAERGSSAGVENGHSPSPKPAERMENGGGGINLVSHEESNGRDRESFDKCPSPRDVLSSGTLAGKRV